MDSKPKSGPGSDLTEFGAELYRLALDRQCRSMAALQRRMKSAGVEVSRQSLAAYANGTRRVPPSLGRKLVRALELTYEEETSLARAIAYGQPDEGSSGE